MRYSPQLRFFATSTPKWLPDALCATIAIDTHGQPQTLHVPAALDGISVVLDGDVPAETGPQEATGGPRIRRQRRGRTG